MSLQQMWKKTLDYLKPNLSPVVYQEYMETLKPVHYDEIEKHLVLRVDADFKIDLTVQKYNTLILKALRFATGGRDITVQFLGCDEPYAVAGEYEINEEPVITSPKSRTKAPSSDISRFSPKYTFDTFVVGSNNRMAHAAALAVAQNPAKKYNPLFIYGGVGLGKTHLMHAIAQEVLKNQPDMNIVYVSSEKFTNDFIDAIRRESNIQFRNTYRNVDMLLIDDIQFLAGKEGTQEEFFHTFNDLHSAGKQIILSSDKPPRDIPDLEERLRSRFEWGLSCDVAPPNFETRVAILRKKAEEEGMKFPNENEVFEYIAQNVSSNIRELEGVLLRFKVLYELNGGNITRDDMKSMLTDIVPATDKKITADAIIQAVSRHYGVSTADVLSSKRTSNVAKARQVGMYLARELTDLSQAGIGESFGGRDHSTVIHACTKIRSQAESDMMFARELKEITNDIKNSNY